MLIPIKQIGVTNRQTFSNANVTVNATTTLLVHTGNSLTSLRTITLPTGVSAGYTLHIVDETGLPSWWFPLRIVPPSGTINGYAHLDIVLPWGSARFIFTGSNWVAALAPPTYRDFNLIETDFYLDNQSNYTGTSTLVNDGNFPGFRTAGTASGLLSNRQSNIGFPHLVSGTGSSDRFHMVTSTTLSFGLGLTRSSWRVHIPRLNDGTNNFRLGIGFGTSTTSVSNTVGAWFSYNQSGAPSSTNWVTETAAGGTTRKDTGVAVSVGFVMLSIEANPAGTEIRFFINNSLVTTHIAGENLPGSGNNFGVWCGFLRDTGTTQNIDILGLDSCKFLFLPTNPR